MEIYDIVNNSLSLCNNILGESATLTINDTEHTITVIVTSWTRIDEEDDWSRDATTSKSFRFQVPSTAERNPREDDTILYKSNEYTIQEIQSGIYDQIQVLATQKDKRSLGNRRERGSK